MMRHYCRSRVMIHRIAQQAMYSRRVLRRFPAGGGFAPYASHSFSTRPKRKTGGRAEIKPWLQRDRNVQSRFQELMAARNLHPADFADDDMRDLIKRCGQLNSLEGMKMVHDILDKLIVEKRKYQMENGSEYMIGHSMFSTALYGWVNVASSMRVAQNRMKELLDLAIAEAQHDAQQFAVPSACLPTVQLYNTYLHGLSMAAKLTPQAAVTAEATLYEMSQHQNERGWHTKPNSRSYSLVLTAFANTEHEHSGERALNLLRRVQEIHNTEKDLYTREFQVEYNLTNALANKRQIVTPDAAIYTSAMKALIPTNPRKAVDLLVEAIERGVVLDAGMFIMPIKSMATSVDRETNGAKRFEIAMQAEEVLGTMIKLWNEGAFKRDTEKTAERLGFDDTTFLSAAYNCCLDVWSKSFCREAPERCETILELMLSDQTGPDVEVSFITFNSCLYAWYKSLKFFPDAADRAAALLTRQHELALKNAKPDFQSYAIVINAYGKSRDPLRLDKARMLLENMLEKASDKSVGVSRNTTSPFTALLGAIARFDTPPPSGNEFQTSVDTQSDPYSVASEIYFTIRTDAAQVGTYVDHHAAAAFLRCIARHCSEGLERENAARMAFEDACSNGQVSRLVVDSLKTVLGDKKIDALYPDLLKRSRRPKSWSQNVSGAFR